MPETATARATPAPRAVPQPVAPAKTPPESAVADVPDERATGRGSVATSSSQSTGLLTVRNEQARTLACSALVSRDDPAEKSRYLGFFARECADYPMPSSWKKLASTRARMPSRPPAALRTNGSIRKKMPTVLMMNCTWSASVMDHMPPMVE